MCSHRITLQGIENKRTYDLTEEELTTLRAEVENYTVEGDLVGALATASS